MIRKLWMGGMVLALSLVSVCVAAAEQATPRQFDLPIKVLYNARQVAFPDARPKIENNRVLVPIRFVAETLGANVDFRDKLVTIRQEGKVIELPIGSDVVKVNGQPITLDTKAVAEKGRTYVPLRFVSEALGQTVEWDSVSRLVWIGGKDVPLQEEIGEKHSFDEFLPMHEKRIDLIDQYDFERDSVYVFTREQLPVRLTGDYKDIIIYSIWEDAQQGFPVIKVHYSGLHFGLYFLTDSDHPRYRSNMIQWRIQNPDGSFVGVFMLQDVWDEYKWGLKGWDKFDYSDIRYIGFTMGPHNMPLLKYD